MKTFEYVAADHAGKLVSGTLMSVDEVHLDRELEHKGLTLTRAKSVKLGRSARRLKLRREDLVNLTTQLATVTGAGVPIVDGLTGIGMRLESPRGRELVENLVKSLKAGMSLSQAMEPFERSFPTVYRASVRAGESAGALDLVLMRLARYLEWARTMRATTIQALIYPAILFAAIFGLIFILLYSVLPKILGLFPSGIEDLPLQTRVVVGASDFVRGNIVAIGIVAVLAVVGFKQALKKPRSRAWIHGLILRIPKLGKVAQKIATSKFASTAATLQTAGCDVFSVLEISSATCGNASMNDAFARATERVRNGEMISTALEKEPLIDPLLVQMVHVGEKSGALDTCLTRLVEYYDVEVPRTVKKFLSFLEPMILLGAGFVVAFILMAALLPIFQLYEQIG